MAADGDEARGAWLREALARFEGPLLRYARRVTGCPELAREAVQETLLRCWGEERFRNNGHPEGDSDRYLANWLFAVCRTRAIDALRKERRMMRVAELEDEAPAQGSGFRIQGSERKRSPRGSALPEVAATERTPAESVETRDSTAAVLRALETLPLRQQEVVVLKFQAAMSYQQIAEVTGLSVSNVGFLMHTAIKTMRAQLGTSGP